VDYLGYYRIGSRVVFAYRVGNTEYLDAAWSESGRFVREIAPRAEHSLATKLSTGQPQWPQKLSTEIKLGAARPYAIDTIALPMDNPWRAVIYCGDHDFLPDGSALVCTMQGDVWHVSGFSNRPGEPLPRTASWRRFAAGLHHALGLRIDRDGIFVLGRDQITRLHDENHDGEADFYECFSRAYETSAAGHDFICGLQRDAAGNFYTASGNQGLLQISPDGKTADVIAAGFRNPDGLGIYPDGTITVPCSEGDWTPASMICAVTPARLQRGRSAPSTQNTSPSPILQRPVSTSNEADTATATKAPQVSKDSSNSLDAIPFYGHRGKQYVKRPIERPELPLVYLPRGLDNSAGGQVFVDSQRWGPLAGQMVHLSFGSGAHFLLLRDEVAGQLQGAVVPLEGQFASGAHRGRFSPHDGQLYVSGMAGWGSYTLDPGSFERVRFTGDRVQLPIGFHMHENGIAIRFPHELDQNFCESAQHFAQAWNYRYSSAYGSPEYSALHYGVRGHDQLRVASARVLADRQTLFLELPDLQLCNQLHVQVATSDDQRHELFATCNALDEPLRLSEQLSNALTAETQTAGDSKVTEQTDHLPTRDSQLARAPKRRLSHPLDIDMLMATKRSPNPWRNPLPHARPVRIEAGKNLTFSTRELRVRAGESIALTLANPDVVPHNWALTKPGKLQSVGEEANKLVADPEAVIRQYVPQSSDVVCYTDIVEPQEQSTIYFTVPTEPGRYPFLCSFPGHWMVMNGELIVEPSDLRKPSQ
jgi:azurin